MERIENDFSRMWENSTDEVNKTYGRSYIDAQIKGVHSDIKTASFNLHPVVETMTDALLEFHPKTRYFTLGGIGLYSKAVDLVSVTSSSLSADMNPIISTFN